MPSANDEHLFTDNLASFDAREIRNTVLDSLTRRLFIPRGRSAGSQPIRIVKYSRRVDDDVRRSIPLLTLLVANHDSKRRVGAVVLAHQLVLEQTTTSYANDPVVQTQVVGDQVRLGQWNKISAAPLVPGKERVALR